MAALEGGRDDGGVDSSGRIAALMAPTHCGSAAAGARVPSSSAGSSACPSGSGAACGAGGVAAVGAGGPVGGRGGGVERLGRIAAVPAPDSSGLARPVRSMPVARAAALAERGGVGVVDAEEAADREGGRDDGGVGDSCRAEGRDGVPAPESNGFARRTGGMTRLPAARSAGAASVAPKPGNSPSGAFVTGVRAGRDDADRFRSMVPL